MPTNILQLCFLVNYGKKKAKISEKKMVTWSGNWWSEQYSSFFVKGTVTVDLPENITSLNNTEINVDMKYTGIYRGGDVVNLKSTATYDNGIINISLNYNNGLLSFTLTLVGNSLEGKYLLTNPYDKGSVQLKQGEQNNSSGCLIS